MSQIEKSPLEALFSRLNSVGLNKYYVIDYLLPDWWCEEVADTDGGFYETMNHIACALGISIAELRGPELPRLGIQTIILNRRNDK